MIKIRFINDRFFIFIFIFNFFFQEPEIIYVEDICRKNEIFSQCQADPNCEKNCDNVDIWESMPCIQTKNCLTGCVCDKGYIRDNNQGICILENSCPRIRH